MDRILDNAVAFRVLGIRVDQADPIEIFPDTQLWSPSRLLEFLPASLKGAARRHYIEENGLDQRRGERADSYLVVRAGPPKAYKISATFWPKARLHLGGDAHGAWRLSTPRADEAMGVLSLGFLTRLSSRAPALRHHVLAEDRAYHAISEGRLQRMSGGATLTIPNRPVSVSGTTVAEWLEQPGIREIYAALSPRNHKGTAAAVAAVARKFPYCIHSQNRSYQVVLAHMGIEALLGSSARSVLPDRVRALCGDRAAELFELVTVARNSFVHAGREVESMDVCNSGSHLLASCLARFAQCAGSLALSSRASILQYLDGLAHYHRAAERLPGAILPTAPIRHDRALLGWRLLGSAEKVDALPVLWRHVSTVLGDDPYATFERSGEFVSLSVDRALAARAIRALNERQYEQAARYFSLAAGLPVKAVASENEAETQLVLEEQGAIVEAGDSPFR